MTIATERIRFMGDAKRMDHCVRGLGSRVVLIEYGDFACERARAGRVNSLHRHERLPEHVSLDVAVDELVADDIP